MKIQLNKMMKVARIMMTIAQKNRLKKTLRAVIAFLIISKKFTPEKTELSILQSIGLEMDLKKTSSNTLHTMEQVSAKHGMQFMIPIARWHIVIQRLKQN